MEEETLQATDTNLINVEDGMFVRLQDHEGNAHNFIKDVMVEYNNENYVVLLPITADNQLDTADDRIVIAKIKSEEIDGNQVEYYDAPTEEELPGVAYLIQNIYEDLANTLKEEV